MDTNVSRSDEAPNGVNSESSIPVVQDFKGKPTICLNPNSKYPFSMGLAKCRTVLANISYIQKFVDSQGTTVE